MTARTTVGFVSRGLAEDSGAAAYADAYIDGSMANSENEPLTNIDAGPP